MSTQHDGPLFLERPVVMGVVNVTPDSFSDGGWHFAPDAAVAHGLRLVTEGAAAVDVGGESTRPGARPVPVDEELRRVLPVVEALAAEGVVVSVDTRRATVADAALRHGATLVNDVSGLRHREMRGVLAAHGAPAIMMHTPVDDPSTMQRYACYHDVVAAVSEFLAAQLAIARADGVGPLLVDPGFGFGKTTAHNLELARRLDELAGLGAPIVVGASRKRFLGELTGVTEPAERVAATVAVHLACLDRGAAIVRAHDVAAHVQAIRVWEALRGAPGLET